MFRLYPMKSKLEVKKLPMRVSLFSILKKNKTTFSGPQGIYFLYLLAIGKKACGLNFSSSPFSSARFRKHSSQPSPDVYVSASGTCCDTCYLSTPVRPVALSLSCHPPMFV